MTQVATAPAIAPLIRSSPSSMLLRASVTSWFDGLGRTTGARDGCRMADRMGRRRAVSVTRHPGRKKGRPPRPPLIVSSHRRGVQSRGSIGRSDACRASSFERLREVLAVVQEVHATGALLHQEGDQRRVRLGRVALPAGQDQIVRTVVGGLPTAGTDMVQRDDLGRASRYRSRRTPSREGRGANRGGTAWSGRETGENWEWKRRFDCVICVPQGSKLRVNMKACQADLRWTTQKSSKFSARMTGWRRRWLDR